MILSTYYIYKYILGINGGILPLLTTPLMRRVELSYTEHLHNCQENILCTEQQNIGSSMTEMFALMCRWTVADSFIDMNEIMKLFTNKISDGMKLLTVLVQKNELDLASRNQLESVNSYKSIISSSSLSTTTTANSGPQFSHENIFICEITKTCLQIYCAFIQFGVSDHLTDVLYGQVKNLLSITPWRDICNSNSFQINLLGIP